MINKRNWNNNDHNIFNQLLFTTVLIVIFIIGFIIINYIFY